MEDSERSHEEWFGEAVRVAHAALCARARCGAVIVKDGVLIGEGYNAPPRDDVSARRCADVYDRSKKPKYDLTCCLHAEWRAIIDALSKGNPLAGATLYYVRLDQAGERKPSSAPFCTVCSRLALDVGITTFALWHETGIVCYETGDYNDRSYAYHRADTPLA